MMADARRQLVARREALQQQLPSEGTALELKEVEDALARIDAGTWGRCERCGGAIGRDRLRALPDARFCIACGH